MKPTIIAIVGPTSSGKSTTCKALVAENPTYTHLRLDDFYKNAEDFPVTKGFPDQEQPASLDMDGFFAAVITSRN